MRLITIGTVYPGCARRRGIDGGRGGVWKSWWHTCDRARVVGLTQRVGVGRGSGPKSWGDVLRGVPAHYAYQRLETEGLHTYLKRWWVGQMLAKGRFWDFFNLLDSRANMVDVLIRQLRRSA